MDPVATPDAIEPTEWFVVFHRKAASRFFSLIAFGEFKHVSTFAYCPGFKVWLIYDVQWSGTRISLIADNEQGRLAVGRWIDGCEVVKVTRNWKSTGLHSRLGLYCVSAVKHLIGLRCVAATPSALYRHILRSGGMPLATRPATAASG